MKTSTKAAAGAGMITAAVGIGCAFLCPVAGLALGAYFTYGAAAAAAMSTPAIVALTAAGAVGGLIVGRIAAPIVALASVGVGFGIAGAVKLFGAAIEKLKGANQPEGAARHAYKVETQSSFKAQLKLAASFAGAKSRAPANENAAPAPQLKRVPGFRL
jgi:hypothetical protein